MRQYSVEKVWLPKLHYRGPLNWQGNSVHSYWSFLPADKGELIKNKNLIKLVLNLQQLQGIHEMCRHRLPTFHKAVARDSLKNSWIEKKSEMTLICVRVTHSTRAILAVLYCHVKISMRYILLVTVTHFTLKCASFLEWAAIALLWWSPGSARLSSHDAKWSLNYILKWDVIRWSKKNRKDQSMI